MILYPFCLIYINALVILGRNLNNNRKQNLNNNRKQRVFTPKYVSVIISISIANLV